LEVCNSFLNPFLVTGDRILYSLFKAYVMWIFKNVAAAFICYVGHGYYHKSETILFMCAEVFMLTVPC
jgi:hypothetical protein